MSPIPARTFSHTDMKLIVLIVVSISALAGAGFLYQWLGARMDLRRNAGAGRWVEIGTGQRLYLREMGVSGPVGVRGRHHRNQLELVRDPESGREVRAHGVL